VSRVVPIAFVLLLAPAPTTAGGDAALRGEAKVNAERLRVDHEHRRAEFEGNVHALYSGIALRCDRMVVTYGEGGELRTLAATGKVVVTRDDVRAEAETATLRARGGVLVLEGDPVLIKGAYRLSGSRIRVSLKSGELEVEEARGVFHFNEEPPR
jgi:lipopolysaccharide transport protein LptA